ncbi:MAG: hypothetical protein JJE32_02750 [Deltaproteobacteria bacterium]|nr:hypothetical protein [Deltaproteobacteria bacterium]
MERTCVTVLPGRQLLLLVSVFLLIAFACATAASAATVNVDLLSDNKGVLTLYRAGSAGEHDTFRAYVEAEKGEQYGIRIQNNTARRVGVVVAVDGRNIISGKKSNLRRNERMYILGPHESETYDGWRTAKDTVNRFYFTKPGASYAAAFGDTSAMGVVAVAVYREKDVPVPRSRVYNREKEQKGAEDRSMPGEPGPRGVEEGAPGSLAPKRSGKAAGTGFGDEKHSPSIRVRFNPEAQVAESHFLKYEWRDTLCRKGIINCRFTRNRFWNDDDGYAPYPPGRRWKRSRIE